MTEIIDVESRELAPVGQVSIYRSSDPAEQLAEARERARVLVEVVREQGLAKKLGGQKEHVQVEAWQFLGSQFGLIADIEWTKELEDGWEARAALIRLADGAVLTHADAECRRAESNWKNRDSYAIRSMAQTRAVSKVFRNALSSVMVMAGFSGTPAEEMDHGQQAPATVDDPHCPACKAINGELVGVYQNKKSPWWKCRNKPGECAGTTEKNGKKFSWSGWHEDWQASVDQWFADNPQHAGPQVKAVSGRGNRWGYVLRELLEVAGLEGDDAKQIAKAGLVAAVHEGQVDVEAALGRAPDEKDPSDSELAAITKNLSAAEADCVVAQALGYVEKSTYEADPAAEAPFE